LFCEWREWEVCILYVFSWLVGSFAWMGAL
jgi:hypothetical protein